jgi:hypothetical protein
VPACYAIRGFDHGVCSGQLLIEHRQEPRPSKEWICLEGDRSSGQRRIRLAEVVADVGSF